MKYNVRYVHVCVCLHIILSSLCVKKMAFCVCLFCNEYNSLCLQMGNSICRGCLIETKLFLSLSDYEKQKSDSFGRIKMSDVITIKLMF